ncbi:MAG TPA: acyl-phosphate glycerol 3-phosphate acyltransferase [Elusimicrobia bacterium]|jgi:glycerol-3-phosphate acyltransferase PlsY|nr:acyl-phosphate glycerol 3-phosphate acyltransferase [Elusimicrobiota bacterium]
MPSEKIIYPAGYFYYAIYLLLAYFLGSIPTGYLVGKFSQGIDIRKYGSGNIGATNVLRTLGKKAAIFTLLFDFAKGYIPTLLAEQKFQGLFPFLVGIMVIFGHTWTIFLKFRGGKGVATTAGVFLALFPLPTLSTVVVFTLLVILTGYISVGSMGSALFLPLSVWFFEHSFILTLVTSFISFLIIFNHRQNIQRLIQGKENKFTLKTIQTR